MRRRFILWYAVAWLGMALGCAAESTVPSSTVDDAVQATDSTADGAIGDPDTYVDDFGLDAEPPETDAWVDVPGAPDLPPVFVDCQIVGELNCGDLLEGVSNGGEDATKVLGWYACQPEVKAMYAASPETTYRFTASAKTRVTVQELSDTDVDLFAVRDTGEGCAGSASSCVAGHASTLVWEAQEGESFFIVLDGRDGGESILDLEVSCCVPSCDGRVCGGDGCGGSCGECGEDTVCDGGLCVDPANLSCNPSVLLGCGQVLLDETFLSQETTSSVDTLNCSNVAMPGPERAYSLQVEDGGLISVSVASENDEVAGLFLLEAGDAACAADACLTGGESEIAYLAEANSQYTLLVEGKEGANSGYTIDVTCCKPSCEGVECGDDGCGGSCGACTAETVCMDGSCVAPPEPTCEVKAEIACTDGLLNVDLGAMGVSNSTFASPCVDGDLSGGEVGFAFLPEEDGNVVFKVESKDFPGDVALTLLTDEGQGCDGTSCIAGAVESLEADVSAGTAYYLVVDGLDGAEGELTLSSSCCTPNCVGKTCGGDGCGGTCGACDAGTVCQDFECTMMPEPTCKPDLTLACGGVVSGELAKESGVPSAIYGYSCNPFDYSGAEVAYAFSVPTDAKVQVALTSGPDAGELDLFLVADDKGACHSANCQTWGDTSLTFAAQADEVSYLVVDGFMGDGGSYDLSVECCYPACAGKSCGMDDGCGGLCGCDEKQVCFEGLCVTPSKGDSCDNPWLIQTLPYSKSASTNGPFADAVNTDGGCDSQFSVGEGVTDVVYKFVPEESGTYLVELEGLENGAAPSVLYALNDCKNPASTCLGYNDQVLSGASALQVVLQAKEAVYIVVDGLAADDIGAFSFSMDGPL